MMLCCVVLCRVVWCGVCVWCVVCETLKKPTCPLNTCFNTCARGAGIHGDVLNVHTETC